jgi:hypothetical protein
MRLLREPWRFVLAWTALCAILVALLLSKLSEPISPRCIDNCDLTRVLAAFGVLIIVMGWFVVIAIVLTAFRRGER